MEIIFGHVNIIARDWKKLSTFYEDIFGCIPVPPERNLSGEWIEKGTGVPNATIRGVHLKLPGYDTGGPTLEIFQYGTNKKRIEAAINREGLAHIAFRVDNIEAIRDKVLKEGGKLVGEIVTVSIEGARKVTFLYLTDPEGNLVELQKWS